MKSTWKVLQPIHNKNSINSVFKITCGGKAHISQLQTFKILASPYTSIKTLHK